MVEDSFGIDYTYVFETWMKSDLTPTNVPNLLLNI